MIMNKIVINLKPVTFINAINYTSALYFELFKSCGTNLISLWNLENYISIPLTSLLSYIMFSDVIFKGKVFDTFAPKKLDHNMVQFSTPLNHTLVTYHPYYKQNYIRTPNLELKNTSYYLIILPITHIYLQ